MSNKTSTNRWLRAFRGENGWRLAALLLTLTVAGIGCNPIATVAFLVNPWFPNNNEPICPLTLPDKTSKVVFVCAHADVLASDPAFRDADQIICRQLTTLLTQNYKENKDKVEIVPVTKVTGYLRSHPDWLTRKREIGKQFDADLLVYLELGPMTMIEPGSSGTLYRGKVEIQITVIDVQKADGDGAKYDPPFYTCVYPTSHPEDTTGMSAANFRAKFLERVAKDLVAYFATTPPKDKLNSD